MPGEQLYYSTNSFAYRFDDEGRIIDNITGERIGICNQKKKEILADYNTISAENIDLKKRLSEIEDALEKHRETLPDDLKKFILKPPTVESLQGELSELKSMLHILINERGVINDNNGVVSKPGPKPRDSKGSGSKAEFAGDKPE